jgi:hypothetical protein
VKRDSVTTTGIAGIDPKLTEKTGALARADRIASGDPSDAKSLSQAMPGTGSQRPSFAAQSLLNDATTTSQNIDPDDLAIEQAPSRKNRLRGIFRRVSRVFEKTAGSNESTDKHGVLIGNLQIALK